MAKLSKAQYAELLKRQMSRQAPMKPFADEQAMMGMPAGPAAPMPQPQAQPQPDPMTEMMPSMAEPTLEPSPMGERLAEMEHGQVGQLDDLEQRIWLGLYNDSEELQKLGDPAAAYNMALQGQGPQDPDIQEFVMATGGSQMPQPGEPDEAEMEAWTAFLSPGESNGGY